MSKADQIRAMMAVGNILECVENTYVPEMSGTLRRMTKCGTTVVEAEILNGPKAGTTGYRGEIPKARDVLALTDDQVTYRLGRGDHTITLRVVGVELAMSGPRRLARDTPARMLGLLVTILAGEIVEVGPRQDGGFTCWPNGSREGGPGALAAFAIAEQYLADSTPVSRQRGR